MKRPLLPVFLIIACAGALLWRETRSGTLESPELEMSRWAASASGAIKETSLPTLVFQGGVSQSELSDFDIGMFVRACSRLGAKVAAVATYEFPSSQLSLQTPASSTSFIAGCLLVEKNATAGISPEPLQLPEREKWNPETFSGCFSAFSPGRGWQAGFLNLPVNKDTSDRLTVFSRLQGNDVSSFAFACFLAAQRPENKTLPPLSGSPSTGISIASLTLPVSKEGLLPQDASLIRLLKRVDMDDLLLQAERTESGRSVDKKIVGKIKGKIVLLGTLSQEDSSIRIGGKRQLSMVEYQGLAIASILAQASQKKLPWWGDILLLSALCAYSLALWFVRISWILVVSAASLAGYFLFALSCTAQFGFALPLLFPSLLILCAACLRYLLRQHDGETA